MKKLLALLAPLVLASLAAVLWYEPQVLTQAATMIAGPSGLTPLSGTTDGAVNVTIASGTGAITRVLTATTAAVNNAAQASTDLWTYNLPASTFTNDGQVLQVRAWGRFAANTNGKTIALIFGASGSPTLATTTSISSATSLMWKVEAVVLRASSSTLTGHGVAWVANGDGTAGPTIRPLFRAASLTDTQTAAITIKVNAASATNTASDMTLDGAIVTFERP